MNWSDEATERFAILLAYLPTSMRPRVEEEAEVRAEFLTNERRLEAVPAELAEVALIECTPVRMRPRMLEAMEWKLSRK